MEWYYWDHSKGERKDSVTCELYENSVDPDENENIAYKPENRQKIINLSAQLKAGWKTALPPKK